MAAAAVAAVAAAVPAIPYAMVTTLAGSGVGGGANGIGAAAQFRYPQSIAVSPRTGDLYVTDKLPFIRKINPGTGIVETIYRFDVPPMQIAVSPTTDLVYATNWRDHILEINLVTKAVRTFAAGLQNPFGVAVSPTTGLVYISDVGTNCIHTVDPRTGAVTILAGSSGVAGFADGIGTAAQFHYPQGIAVSPSGDIYVADSLNHKIRKINPTTKEVTTFEGFYFPMCIAVSPQGSVYVSEVHNHRILQLDPTTGAVEVFAGSGEEGFAEGARATAQFSSPMGIAVSPSGNVYVADMDNHRIRVIRGMLSFLRGRELGSSLGGSLGGPSPHRAPASAAAEAEAEAAAAAGITLLHRRSMRSRKRSKAFRKALRKALRKTRRSRKERF